jgi:hypothetical protein
MSQGMLKRLVFAFLIPAAGMASIGCTVEHRRPVVVEPRYVARCPDGYRYDGNECRRVAPPPERVVIEVEHR